MKGRLAILGASGHGKVVACAAEAAGWERCVFFDDAWPNRQQNGSWPIAGDGETLLAGAADFDGAVVAIGDNETRLAKARLLLEAGIPLVTIVHPAATVSPYAQVGPGSVVFAGAVVNADAVIGLAAIVNSAATVDHDCNLGDGVHVSPGAHLAGAVTIGDLGWIGIGACVRQGIRIGSRCIVGAGAAVVDDVGDGLRVVGVPARPL